MLPHDTARQDSLPERIVSFVDTRHKFSIPREGTVNRNGFLSISVSAGLVLLWCYLPSQASLPRRGVAEFRFSRLIFHVPNIGSAAVRRARATRGRAHAASKPTPGIAVRMSTPTGSRPMRKNGPGSSKSPGVKPCSGAPNSAKDPNTASRFRYPLLPECRGLWLRGAARGWQRRQAPMTRYLTRCAVKMDKSSL